VNPRVAGRSRVTKETSIDISLDLDGSGQATADTGLPFFDHMLAQLGRHAGFDLSVMAKGDLEVDQHHTVEDVAILLGETLAEALGDKAGIRRFASIAMVLDEARVEVALDLSGRPYLVYEVDLRDDAHHLGTPPFNPEMFEHFWQSFATAARITLHISEVVGSNTHHIAEACFKGVARCLREAVRVEGTEVPSTKGTL
jgi:imidazoleglycerol-phosphate dehydratase